MVFTATPHRLAHQLSPPPVALDSDRLADPNVNCGCQGARLCPPYGNAIRIHPSQPHPQLSSLERLSSMKPVPGAKKIGGLGTTSQRH